MRSPAGVWEASDDAAAGLPAPQRVCSPEALGSAARVGRSSRPEAAISL